MAQAPRPMNGGGVDLTDDAVAQNLVLDNFDLTPEDLAGDDTEREIPEEGADDLEPPAQRGQQDYGDDEGDVEPRGQQQREPVVSHTERDRARAPTERTIHSRAEVKADGKGNLVNAQGAIVARAGKEARLYQDANNQRVRADGAEAAARDIGTKFQELATHARSLLTEVQSYRARDTQIQSFGLKPDEQMKAYQIFLELRDKPEVALQKLLTRASAGGIDITKLGLEGGVHAKSLVDMLRTELGEAVKPIRERTALEQQQQQQREADQRTQQAANEQVNSFIAANPDAEQWLPTIHKILSDPRGRGMSLEHVWDKIQLNLAQNGRVRTQSNSRRMPSGRGAPMGNPPDGDDIAPVSMSYDDIIKTAMGA